MIKSAIIDDTWDLSDADDAWTLFLAYRLAGEVCDTEEFIALTDDVLNRVDYPLYIKTWVTTQRVYPLAKTCPDKARKDAVWLIKTRGLNAADRSHGYEAMTRIRGQSPDTLFYYNAMAQSCRGGYVDYLYREIGDYFYRKADFAFALGAYVRAWALATNAERQKALEQSIADCLEKMALPEKAAAWRRWLAIASKNRPACPIFGLGSLPEEWRKQWDHSDTATDASPTEICEKAKRLFANGKFAEAKPLFLKVLANSENVQVKNAAKMFLDLYDKWGERFPTALP